MDKLAAHSKIKQYKYFDDFIAFFGSIDSRFLLANEESAYLFTNVLGANKTM